MPDTFKARLIPILTLAVFLTGFSALLYQIVWQRLLGLFSGSDVRSVTIVTSVFLAGLGVGSLLGSLFADRFSSRDAVRAFGMCNLGIGLFAFMSRFFFYDLLFLRLYQLAESPALLLLLVFISLLLPTTLMGLSLPFLARAIVRQVENAAPLITRMYGFNTLGAGFGTIIAGWLLIGSLGYEIAIYLGAILSAGVGVLALVAAGRFASDDQSLKPSRQSLSLKHVPRGVWLWCLLVFTSGYTAISLEIIWFRILDVLLKSNAYTFAHLLAFFLIGDAVGSLVGARALRWIKHPRRAFLLLQGLIALYALGSISLILALADNYPLANYISETGNKLVLSLDDNRIQWFVYLAIPALMMLPPAFLIGFYYPIVHKAVQTDPKVVGQRVGLLEVSNIAGNTLGGILTGVALLHVVGTSGALRIIGVIGLVFVLFLLYETLRGLKPLSRVALCGLAFGLLALIFLFPNQQNLWGRLHNAQSDEVFHAAEDSSGVSAILERGGMARLYANGQDQGTIPFSGVHNFLGVLPALVHPDPQNILVIGIGSGGTPYAVGVNPLTEHILAIEIIGSELDVLRAYAAEPHIDTLDAFLNDSRYEIRVGDGRRELFLTEQRYNIIQADAIRPVSSHSGLLYSREYFQTARERLAEGGIMAQWNPTWRVEATFVSVFPYALKIGDILLGSDSPINYEPLVIYERLHEPEIVAYLEAGGVDVAALRGQMRPPAAVWLPDTERIFPADAINTDLFPRDEYYLNNGG